VSSSPSDDQKPGAIWLKVRVDYPGACREHCGLSHRNDLNMPLYCVPKEQEVQDEFAIAPDWCPLREGVVIVAAEPGPPRKRPASRDCTMGRCAEPVEGPPTVQEVVPV
jgi:hypothetical protein